MQQFLQNLPIVKSENLPAGSEYMICKTPHNTVTDDGKIEHAVQLACEHIVESGCIS